MVPFPLPATGWREASVSARSLHRLLGGPARVLAGVPISTVWSVRSGRHFERATWFPWRDVARFAGRPAPHQAPHRDRHRDRHDDPHQAPWESPRGARFASRRPCS